jgi:hypothetical protein
MKPYKIAIGASFFIHKWKLLLLGPIKLPKEYNTKYEETPPI